MDFRYKNTRPEPLGENQHEYIPEKDTPIRARSGTVSPTI